MNSCKADDILKFLDSRGTEYRFTGNGRETVGGVCGLQELQSGSICWIKSKKYASEAVLDELRSTEDILVVCPFEIDGVSCIVTDYPKGVFFSIANRFFAPESLRGISPKAEVLAECVGENVYIGPGCYICGEAVIGDNTVIHPNVSIISPCVIGSGCEIYSGAVIGADGGGYYIENGVPHREKHFKGVRIGDNVDIGANTCIDRGLLTDTVIGNNVKIDNLCHIGHNVVIEDNCLIIAGSVICGSAHIEQSAYLAPASVVLNQLTIGSGSTVGVNSAAIMDVRKDTTVFGTPAKKLASKDSQQEKSDKENQKNG